MFWSSYFANQRGQPKEGQKALLQLVMSKIKKETFDIKKHDTEMAELWHHEHDVRLNDIAGKLRKYAEDWLESDAGDGFETMLDAVKYFRAPLSTK